MNKFNFILRLFSKSRRKSTTDAITEKVNDVIAYTVHVPMPGTDTKSIEVHKTAETLPKGKDVVIKPMYSFFMSESKVN